MKLRFKKIEEITMGDATIIGLAFGIFIIGVTYLGADIVVRWIR